MKVVLRSTADLERWCAYIHPGPSGPSSLVEYLSLFSPVSMSHPSGAPWTLPSCETWIQPPILSSAAAHLRSFSGLRALEITGWDTLAVEVSSVLHYFAPSSENITRLTMKRTFIRSSAFVTFVSRFPRLHYLSISTFKRPWGADGVGDLHPESHGSVVPTHPRGEFSALEIARFDEPEKVLGGIALLEPWFRRVTLMYASCDQWRFFWPIMEACAGSLEELEILDLTSIGEWLISIFDCMPLITSPRCRLRWTLSRVLPEPSQNRPRLVHVSLLSPSILPILREMSFHHHQHPGFRSVVECVRA